MPFQTADIGPRYDVGISTRDGSALSVKNKDGQLVSVSQLAYMFGTDRQTAFKEATELQEKSALIQLGSSNLIDREFDQWPQVTQGDWSGGIGQRVFGSNGISNQYFDGEGLLWPVNDWIPQKAFPGPHDPMPGTIDTAMTFSDLVGGFVNGAGPGYAKAWRDNTGAHAIHASFRVGDTVLDASAAGGANFAVLAMTVALGYVWILYADLVAGGNVILGQFGFNTVGGGAYTSLSATNVVANLFANGKISAVLTGGIQPGGKAYLAVGLDYQTAAAVWANQVSILDASNLAGAATVITLPTFQAIKITDLNFQGANLNIAVTDGFSASILQSTPPYSATSNLVTLSGLALAYMTSVGSTIFIDAASIDSSGAVNRLDLFTLTAGTLTEIGTITTPVPLLIAITSPTTFGTYALFGVSYQVPGAATKTITVYAFDVSRSRLFRVLTTTDTSFTGPATFVHDGMAVFGSVTRTQQAGVTFEAQFGVALPTSRISVATDYAREFYWGVLPLTPAPPFVGLLRMGCDLISGLIDFTAATNKLFRQIAVIFQGGLVPTQATGGVTANAWLNEDPEMRDSAAQFSNTTSIVNLPTPTAELDLVVNTVARKLVYEVISFSNPLVSLVATPTYTEMGRATQANQIRLSGGLTVTGVGANVGDLVVVTLYYQNTALDTTTTITDSRGNTYALDKTQPGSGSNFGIAVWHSVLTTALQLGDTITITFKLAGNPVSEFFFITAMRIQGVPNAIFDQSASAVGTSTTPDSGATGAIAVAAEAMIGLIGSTNPNQRISAGTGWTDFDHVLAGPIFSVLIETQTSAAIATYDATGTMPTSGPWTALIVTYKPGPTSWVSAPKIVSVAIQAATGWVVDCSLIISPTAKTNGQSANQYCYQAQGFDHVAAYNFLKQLWRLKGGQITVNWPNGDTYNALIQQMEFDSPKPFAVGIRSDQQPSTQLICQIKIREDI